MIAKLELFTFIQYFYKIIIERVDNMKKKTKIIIVVIIVLLILVVCGLLKFSHFNVVLNGDQYITLNYGEEYIEQGATAKYFSKTMNKIVPTGEVDTSKVGKYILTYEVELKSLGIGNKIKGTAYRYVEVVDTKEPTLELEGNKKITVYTGNNYQEPGYKANDEYDGDLTDKVIVNNSLDINKVGTYEIVYEVSDSSNNKVTATRTIEVKEKPKTKNTTGVPVLMYHFFYDKNKESKNDGNWMEIHLFEEQMKYLSENNYYQPTWEELIQYVDGKTTLPEKSVIVTADDGNPSFFELAVPVCQKYNIRCTSFIVSSWTHGDWLKSVYYNKGIDFQTHTYDMHKGGCSENHGGAFNCISHDAGVTDLTKSKTDLEQLNKVYAIAYPFGDYNDNVKTITKDAGIALGFTTQFGKVRPGMDKLVLPRIRVNDGTSLANFAKNL